MKVLTSNSEKVRSTGKIQRVQKANNKALYGFAGIALLLLIWQSLSMIFGRMVVSAPFTTFKALILLTSEKSTWGNIFITFKRLITGLLFGSVVGLGLGIASGLNRKIKLILEPLRWVAMTIPAIVIAIVAMLWLGMGSSQVIFVVTVIIAPFTYINTVEGLLALDEKLIEMGRAFNLPKKMLLTEIYLPGIGSSVMAGLTMTVGMGVRVVVLSELMGAQDGIGSAFSTAWTHLDTPEIFAWILMSLALMGILEFGILLPLRSRIMRWKV